MKQGAILCVKDGFLLSYRDNKFQLSTCLISCLFIYFVFSRASVSPQDGKVMYEQELYNNFSISGPKPYFITFAGDVSFFPQQLHLSFYLSFSTSG